MFLYLCWISIKSMEVRVTSRSIDQGPPPNDQGNPLRTDFVRPQCLGTDESHFFLLALCCFCWSAPPKTNGLNLKITPLKGKIIFQTSILGFHVAFWGCRFFDFRREVTAVLVCLTKAASQSGFWFKICWLLTDTLPETNIAPENGCCMLGWISFWGRPIFRGELLVSGRVISAFCQAKEIFRNGKGQKMDASIPSWQCWSDQLIGPIYKVLQDFSKRNMAFNHDGIFIRKKTWCCHVLSNP